MKKKLVNGLKKKRRVHISMQRHIVRTHVVLVNLAQTQRQCFISNEEHKQTQQIVRKLGSRKNAPKRGSSARAGQHVVYAHQWLQVAFLHWIQVNYPPLHQHQNQVSPYTLHPIQHLLQLAMVDQIQDTLMMLVKNLRVSYMNVQVIVWMIMIAMMV